MNGRKASMDLASSSSSLTLGEKICTAFIPIVALIEALIMAFADCFDHRLRWRTLIGRSKDLALLADESPFTVNEVEALYELFKKLSSSMTMG